MADNTTLDVGSGGDVIATDDIGGVKYQIVKHTYGALDSQTIASSGNGTDDAGTQRVTLASDSSGQVKLAAGTAAIGKLAANSGVDIGDVDVTSIIPGTGATNLGKAIDAVAGSADVGIASLGVHEAESTKVEVADGDWGHLHLGELGGLAVEPEQHNHLDDFNATTDWAALGNDTLNLATTKKHLTGTDALIFDKVDGDANTIFAGIEKTITSVDIGDLDLHDLIQVATYLPSLNTVAYVFCRIGTDSNNYNEWRIGVSELIAAEWLVLAEPVGNANYAGITGNGWTTAAITYIAVGVAFDAETNTLVGIVFDQLGIFTNHHATTQTIEISSTAATGNVNLQKVGGSPTDKGAGNVSNGSQRVVLASDSNFIKVEDVAASGGDAGIPLLAVRRDADTSLVNSTNDYANLQVDADGALKVEIFDGGESHTVDNAGLTELAASINSSRLDVNIAVSSTNTLEVVGDVAHSAAAAGNPVLVAARATANVEGITEVSEAEATFINADLSGTVITRAACAHAELVSFYIANTDGAEDAVTSLDDGGAAIYNFITSVTIHNAHASTNGFVTLLDGSAGSIFWVFPAPATGGTTHNFDPPLRQPTISTALFVDVSAAITTMHISINGYQGNG